MQAQTQLDQLAATLASSLSDITTAGTAVTSGSQAGFDVDLSNVLPGNSISLTYTDTATNTPHQITIVRVDDPTALPLPNTAANPNDKVIGVNFQGGMASIVSQLTAAVGNTNLQFSNPSGSTLRVLDNGAGAVNVNAASTTVTTPALANGNLQLPVFTDGSTLYTGVITGRGVQQTGFAGRITVNAALVGDPSKFIVYNTSPLTTAGDTTRSDFLYSQLTSGSFTYSPQTGLGSRTSPLKGTLPNYLQQFLGLQSNAADVRAAACARPGCRGQHAAAEIQLHFRRQHRCRNVKPDRASEHLRGQRSCDVGRADHDADLDADPVVGRSRWRSTA